MKVAAIYCGEDQVENAGPGETLKVAITGMVDKDIRPGFVLSSIGEYDSLQITFIKNDYADIVFYMILFISISLSFLSFVVVLIWFFFSLFSVAEKPVPAVTEFFAQLEILELPDNVSTCSFSNVIVEYIIE